MDNRTIEELLSKNKTHLQFLRFEFDHCFTDTTFQYLSLPFLPHVKTLWIDCMNDQPGIEDFCQKMLRATPNLVVFKIPSLFINLSLDFKFMTRLKTIQVRYENWHFRDIEIINAEIGTLQEVQFFSDLPDTQNINVDLVRPWIEAFPTITCRFQFEIILHKSFKIEECIWTQTVLTMLHFQVSLVDFPVNLIARNMFTLYESLTALRPGHTLAIRAPLQTDWEKSPSEAAFDLVLSILMQNNL